MFDLKDKVVLITGAATGIGSIVVRFLLDEGVKHVAIVDVAEVAGIAYERELNTKYGANKVKFFKGDVTNDDELFNVFTATYKEYGYIDVVINNAGLMNDTLPRYKLEIQVNVTALVSSTLKAFELMRKDKGGKGGIVVNIASILALCQLAVYPIYSGTKSAVLMFSNIMGMDEYYKKTGIKVITLCFGPTDTALLSEEKSGTYDPKISAESVEVFKDFPVQSAENAARGVVDACKYGESSSTWVVTKNEPAKDCTATVKKAYRMLYELAL